MGFGRQHAFAVYCILVVHTASLLAATDADLLYCWNALSGLTPNLNRLRLGRAPARTGKFKLRETILGRERKQMDADEYAKFVAWYYNQFYADLNVSLADNARSDETSLHPTSRYEAWGQRPFAAYKRAREYLLSVPLHEMGVEHFAQTQKHVLTMMEPGFLASLFPWMATSEMTAASAVGAVRSRRVHYFGIGTKLDLQQTLPLLSSREPLATPGRTVPQVIEGNPFLGRGMSMAYWEYAPISKWRTFERFLDADLTGKLMLAEKRYPDFDRRAPAELRQEFITQILKGLWSQARRDLLTAKTQKEVVRIIGELHHDLISLHPFENGNGRFVRLLTERLLEEFNLPPPIWIHFGEDVVLTKANFVKLLEDSLALSHLFHRELEMASKAQVPYMAVGTPFLGGRKVPPNLEGVQPGEFMMWLAYGGARTQGADVSSTDAAIQAFAAWRKGHDYPGGFGVRFATPLFLSSFGRLSTTQPVFDFKRQQFYTDGTLYKGVPLFEYKSDLDLVRMFVQPTVPLMPRTETSPQDIFRQFNLTLTKMPNALSLEIHDHMRKDGVDSNAVGFHLSETDANRQKRGEHLPDREAGKLVGGMKIEVARRKPAALDNKYSTAQMNLQADYADRQVLLVGGADPESVKRVTVDEVVDGVLRYRTAERIAYNRVVIKEYTGNNRLVRTKTYEFGTNGEIREVKVP